MRSRLPSGSRAFEATNAERVSQVDSSAVVKLVVREKDSAALRRYLRGRTVVSSAFAGVGVIRAILPQRARTLRTVREVLTRIEIVRINASVLSHAAILEPAGLRTGDAVRLATASLFAASPHRSVCSGGRLANAANAGNWTLVTPV